MNVVSRGSYDIENRTDAQIWNVSKLCSQVGFIFESESYPELYSLFPPKIMFVSSGIKYWWLKSGRKI